jgi:trehalose-6-phosphate synthase
MNSPNLVLVSNRIPITFTTEDGKLKGQPSSGGLVSALEPLLKDHGGIWVRAAQKTRRASARFWKRQAGAIPTGSPHSS